MPAHLRDLPRCQTCSRPATCELRNTVNAVIGVFCASCGRRALARFKREHES
jgi:hypothetical protein